MLFILYKTYLYTLTAKFRRQRLTKNPRVLLTLVGLLVLPTFIIVQTQEMFRVWLSVPEFGATFLYRFVSTALFGLFVVLILTGIPVVLHHYFLAPDLGLLGVLPIQKRDVYTFKFFTSATSNLGLFVMVALPLLISLTLAHSATVFAYLAIVLASLLFISIPTGISVLLSLLLAQFVNVKKMRRLTTLLLGLFFIVAWGGLQFYRVSRLNPVSAEFDPAAVDQFSTFSQTLHSSFFPSDWLLNTVVYTVQHNWIAVILNLALLAAVSFLLMSLTSVWRARLEQREKTSPTLARSHLKMPPQISPAWLRMPLGVLAKDMRVIRRDTRFLQSQLLLLAMLLVWPFLQDAHPINPQETLSVVEPYIGLLFIAMLAGLTLARQNFAMEQLAFLYIKLAPLKLRWWMVAKAGRVAFLTALLLCVSVFITAARTDTPLLWAMTTSGIGILMSLTSAFLGQTAAAFATRFDWTDPRYMVDVGWTYFSMIATLLINAFALGILALGFYLSQQIVAFVVFFIYVCVVLVVSLRISEYKLNRLQWTF